jgi:dTDP-4-dehydrorhamnose reductase
MARELAAGGGATGLFHFCGTPATSWCGFARAIFAATHWPRTPELAAISSEQWPTPASRPKNSVLDCRRIAEAYAISQPRWQCSLPGMVSEALSQES